MYSVIKYVADGVSKQFDIPFPFINKNHIKVFVEGNQSESFTFPTSNRIQLNDTPPVGSIVTIQRETTRAFRLVDFQDAFLMSEDALDMSVTQSLYLVQEMVDLFENALALDTDDKFDMRGKVLKNLGEPVNTNDAVTKGYVDVLKNLLITLEASAKQSAQQAKDDAATAASSMTAASFSAANASEHAIEAITANVEAQEAAAEAITANIEAQEAAAEAIAKVDGLGDDVERSETAASNAATSASSASVSASQAQANYEASLIARNDAQAAANTATSKATSAGTSETNASSSAAAARQAATVAQAASVTATSKATASETSATNASNSATVAGQAEQVASEAALLAATYVNFISGGDASGTNTNP